MEEDVKARLFKSRTEERSVDVPGVGSVRVRGLTRAEALAVKDKEIDRAELERYLLSTAMVDPSMSKEDVKRWQEASPVGEIEHVSMAIIELSGMLEASPKNAFPSL